MTATNPNWLLAGMVCAALWPAHVLAQDWQWESYMAAGTAAFQQGNDREAEERFAAGLKLAEKIGPRNRRVATSLDRLAALYRAQGRYAEAEPLFKRALAISGDGARP